MPNEPNFITAIDVGSAKTSVLVAELSENGLRYRGHGSSESRGLRKGVITELDKAVSSIQKAVEHAEDVAGRVRRAVREGVRDSAVGGFGFDVSASIGAGLQIRSSASRVTPGNLYILASADSGTGKSQAFRPAARPSAPVRCRRPEWCSSAAGKTDGTG